MMPELKAQQDTIAEFIEQITDGWSELDGKPVVEIRALSEHGSANIARFGLDMLDLAADHARAMNDAKRNVYMCVNPVDGNADIRAGFGAHDKDILAAFYCFADADTDGAMKNILNFAGPQFTMSVKTGTVPFVRGHCYWRLEEPVANLQAWRETQQSIAQSLKTDEVVINPSRIMRVAGTVSWPSQKKQEKGYTPELVTMRTEFSTDRDPVPFERMMRAFPPVKGVSTSTSDSPFNIDLGKQAMDRALAQQSIMQGEDWHHNVVRLVGSYVSKGLADAEIHAITDNFTQPPYTVDDTRREVQQAIDGARAKGWTPEPQPAVEAMSRQVPAPSVQIDLSNGQSVQQPKVEKPVTDYPTEYDMFDGASLPRRQWLYGTHYLRGFVSVLASAGGIGKTSLQIVEALAMVTGKPLLGEVVHETCNVWIINLEDPLEEMQRRIIAAMQHYNIKPEEVKGRLFVDAGRDFSMTFAVQTRDGVIPNDALVDHLIKKIPERKIGMTFIDPFVGAHQVSENDNGAVNDVVAQIRRVADETNSGMGLVHHIRKGNGEDANVDSIRGAGSLIGAARAARVINKITEDEAVRLGVSEKEASGIFRVDDGKANLAPPTHAAVYRKMIGEQIPNGEWVGVAIEYKMPDEWAGMTTEVTNNILRQIDNGLQNQDGEEYFSKNVQAKERWVGNLITSYPFDKAEDHKSQAQAKIILDRWFKEGLLIEETYRSEKRRKDVKGVFTTGRVGEQYVG